MNMPSAANWPMWRACARLWRKKAPKAGPTLLLEYIKGHSLAELIRAASLDLTEKLRLSLNVARVLGQIHDQQVMHKDVSSGNILVADGDVARLSGRRVSSSTSALLPQSEQREPLPTWRLTDTTDGHPGLRLP